MRISRTKLIKIVILAAVMMLWVVSTIHLYAFAFAGGPFLPWWPLNVAAGIYIALVFWVTDSMQKDVKQHDQDRV